MNTDDSRIPISTGEALNRTGTPTLTTSTPIADAMSTPGTSEREGRPRSSNGRADAAGPPAPVATTSGSVDESPGTGKGPKKRRNPGVDVARGLALLGMFAHHTYPYFYDNGTASVPHTVVGGRGAAAFALLAGVGVALLSGGRRPPEGRARTAVRAGLAVRALLMFAIGLALAYIGSEVDVILTYFGVFFLFAIPLLGVRARFLALWAIGLAVVMPIVFHLVADFLPDVPYEDNPTFSTLFHDPVALVVALCVGGLYPAFAWMAYICAGMAAGRLQLSSPRVATRLLIGGIALAAVAWVASSLLLYQAGGLSHLIANAPKGMSSATVRDWIANRGDGLSYIPPTWSWWWLTISAPHTNAPLDLLHTMGSALALLGAMLLLTRLPVVAKVLSPVALAGGMTLTLYSLHIVLMNSGLLADNDGALLLVQVIGGLGFAVLWRKRFAKGPIEAALSVAATRTRSAVMGYHAGALSVKSAVNWIRRRMPVGPAGRVQRGGVSGEPVASPEDA